MTRTLLLALILLAVGASTAPADWPQDQLSYRGYKKDLYWGKYFCNGAYRPHGCKTYRWRRWKRYSRPSPNPEIMAAQIRLNELGYELEADGFTGPATKNALEVFQEERDLKVTGVLNRETKRALDERGGPDGDGQMWSRRPEICRDDNGRECTCDPIIVFSGEHVSKDAKDETKNRWRGHVRALIGETFMDWENAPDPKILQCWHTGTGERTTDRLGQTRCVAQARACFGPPAPAPYSGSRKED